MAIQKILLNFVVDPILLKRIEDFRFRNRFATRAAAIKWLLDWALKQRPSPADLASRSSEEEPLPPPPLPPENRVTETKPAEPPPPPLATVPEPSRASAVQALRDQGYEVGESTRHPDGMERIAVRSQDRSAWVNVVQELQDLAAARETLAEIAARRSGGR